ncbi:battenin CLN3 protein [Cryptotrichosporon argae]
MEAAHSLRRMTSDTADDDRLPDDEDIDDFIRLHDEPCDVPHARARLFASFLIFGLLNNVLYVIILSAALDLVPSTTPKGIVALFNILPALVAKVFWPLISTGTILYRRRLLACTCISWLGIVTIALSASVPPRLAGIALASFSSGLGELTFLQLTTTLPRVPSRTALGAWASGTGLAGVAGAAIWWALRGLGVKAGLGISSFLPLFFPLTYFYLLPPFAAFPRDVAYDPLPPVDDVAARSPLLLPALPPPLPKDARDLRLSRREKLELLRPLVGRYMVPLAAVYVEEYVINSGVTPTLVFPAPPAGLWSHLFKTPRDFYPFWSLTYQTFVFVSRSSLSLGLPPLPRRLLPLPALTQLAVLAALATQARAFVLGDEGARAITPVFLLVCLEGLCGGLAYVNTFYHVGREGQGAADGHDADADADARRASAEREFRVGAVGAADSCGILLASLISMPVEVALCAAQVRQGHTLCRDM